MELNRSTSEIIATDEEDLDKVVIHIGDVDNEEFTPEISSGNVEDSGKEESTAEEVERWTTSIAILDRGCWMHVKSGKAGETPDKDTFPWYKSNTECFVRLLWDLTPADWRLVAFPDMPKDAYDPDEYLHARQIMISDISEVLLEVDPSVSFRLYLGETNQVVRLTPIPLNREHAGAWVDAIFASMHLQNLEEEVNENGGSADQSVSISDLLELREKFYLSHPNLIPPEYENIEGVEDGQHDGALVVYDPESGEAQTLGNDADTRERPKSRPFSFGFDYHNIYGSRRNSAREEPGKLEPQPQQCCVLS